MDKEKIQKWSSRKHDIKTAIKLLLEHKENLTDVFEIGLYNKTVDGLIQTKDLIEKHIQEMSKENNIKKSVSDFLKK